MIREPNVSSRSPSPAVLPAITQSRVVFLLILIQSFVRLPGEYRASFRFAMMPSFFFQAEDGIRDLTVTGVQTCALPILRGGRCGSRAGHVERRNTSAA